MAKGRIFRKKKPWKWRSWKLYHIRKSIKVFMKVFNFWKVCLNSHQLSTGTQGAGSTKIHLPMGTCDRNKRKAETILIQYDKKSFYSQRSLVQQLFEKAEPHVWWSVGMCNGMPWDADWRIRWVSAFQRLYDKIACISIPIFLWVIKRHSHMNCSVFSPAMV